MIVCEKIKERTLKIAVVGLGYIGLPIANRLLQNRFDVVGIETNQLKISQLLMRRSYISDLTDKDINEMFDMGFIIASDYELIKTCDCVIICVSTPINKSKQPDLRALKSCCDSLAKVLHNNMLVVLESTVYPGCTKMFVKPLLESSGWNIGDEVLLAFSPERMCPGDSRYRFSKMDKLVSGINDKSLNCVFELYKSFMEAEVIKVASCEIAEMAKLLENTYRYINIAFINEFATLSRKMNINVMDVIEAAKTKPIGFSPFYPNIGIGGHCIPVDPYYLDWVAQQNEVEMLLLHSSAQVLDNFFEVCVIRIKETLADKCMQNNQAKVLIIGVAYKDFVNDMRESPSINLIKTLMTNNIECSYYDERVDIVTIEHELIYREFRIDPEVLRKYTLVVLMNYQENLDKQMLLDNATMIFDIKDMLKVRGNDKVFTL